ncbi:MAG TPA: DNA helicase PriA [Candidatus Atribacteria bacterium]|nr:DNA helicase PriA [Candidatus Atribacteria bacterium]
MSSVKQYKCLNCNAGLKFDPPSQLWKCEYCFGEFTKEQLDSIQKVDEQLDQEMPDLESYHCNNCGAELITDGTTSATFCLYCKSPTVIKARFTGRFKPKYLIPFKLTKKQAEELYKNWIRKKLLAPSAFKQKEEIEKITGVYAPFWLFDCKVKAHIGGEATRVRTWTQGNYRITQTQYYRVARAGRIEYDKIPVDASKKLDDGLMQLVEPYNYQDLTDFSMQYMSGFMAEKYDVESKDAQAVMQSRVEGYAEQRLRGTIQGYTSTTISHKQVDFEEITDSYAMLPIYLLVNKHKDKNHTFIINGQTGKVVGETPLSRGKQLAFAGCVFAAVWFLIVFGGALFA